MGGPHVGYILVRAEAERAVCNPQGREDAFRTVRDAFPDDKAAD
jgi:hypothetical protein